VTKKRRSAGPCRGDHDREGHPRRPSRRDFLRAGAAAPLVLSLSAIAGAADRPSGEASNHREAQQRTLRQLGRRRGSETFVNYWIGQEPTPPSPTLDQVPGYVDVVPLAFVYIDATSHELDFDFLTQNHSAAVIQSWIRELRARGTDVLFSIQDDAHHGHIADIRDVDAFVENVVDNALIWGVNGVDLDYEPASIAPSQTLLEVTAKLRTRLRSAIREEPVLTSPIFSPWLQPPLWPEFLHLFAAELDFVTTQDYSPYPGYQQTISYFEQYVAAIGTPSKIAIGMSCIDRAHSFTPLDDVASLCQWQPQTGRKKGAMLYTASYDVQARQFGGTGYPDWTFTESINANLP
jgi:hypothetical protein